MLNSWNGVKQGSQLLLPQLANAQKAVVQPKNGTSLTPQQQHMLQLRQVRSKLSTYHFASTSTEILRKYAKFPASLSFHIYDTHYRFNNTQDSSIIPKSSPMAKSFLRHIINEEIPTEMTELLKDFAIRFFDGCIILQVYDHRNMIPSNPEDNAETKTKEANSASTTAINGEKEQQAARKPKTYRTLLRPTAQSLYYDLLYHTDPTPTKFTDQLSLQMEAEILTLTNRKLDLTVPLNPYLQDEYLQPESEYPKKVWDEKKQDWNLVHRHLPETPRESRKLHQDQLVMHKSSEYEELMFLLSNNYKNPADSTSEKKLVVVGPSVNSKSDAVSLEATPTATSAGNSTATEKAKRPEKPSTISTAAAVLSASNATSNQFMRLRFIEEIRKRKETQKAQAGAAVAAQTQGSLGASAGADGQKTIAAVQRQQQLKQQALVKLMSAQLQQQQQQQQHVQQNQVNQGNHLSNNQTQQTLQQQMQGQIRGQPQRPGQQLQQGISNPIPQNFQNATQRMQNIPRQTLPVGNQQSLGQSSQQQQMAKQANFMRAQQYQIQQARQQQIRQQQQMGLVQNQSQNANPNLNQIPAAKRQKVGGVMGQIPQQNQQFGQGIRAPQISNSQPGSNLGTPVMANGIIGTPRMGNVAQTSPQMGQQIPQMGQQAQNSITLQQRQQQQQQQMGQRSTPQTAASNGQNTGQYTLQQQQQQIFQRTLSPQEQHAFRQLQARMNALVQMGNTGIAPNRSQLTPQQQQQAIQQAKHIQQQLLQKFPTYFQRLRQFQLLQQQRRQAMQRQQPGNLLQGQQSQQQAPQGQQNIGNLDGSMYGQQNVVMNMSLPMMQQQQMMGLPMMQQQMNNNMQQGLGKNLKRG